ncbi:uncharacterized protein BYT42DRAFT_223382 [Radiomyces spectabilis]|uniref:uncharacterized protein n=1 Tax=Radiomyces spectabilis TaxID=64574 RepID=UPI00221E89DE|nr:uncharacterized protein BYT42DRAFT_223382 [Radiomyces spectabilis]KAI8388129.1 hypothetical protein BYT42DRAFT_223382 [Radiomyces spectabilis]
MNKIDFLPVVCIYCNKVFCGDHRLPFDHDCREYSLHDREAIQCPQCQKFLRTPSVDTQKTNAEQIVEEHLKSRCVLHCILTETKDPKFRCSVSGCNHKESVVGKVHCDKCDHDFCVKHRHPLSHQCISLNADEERKVQRREAAQEKLAKTFKPPPSSPVTQRKANRDTAQKKNTMVEMMKIKAKAKGLTSVPLNSRIYLYVHFPKETHTEPQPMFFDKLAKHWTCSLIIVASRTKTIKCPWTIQSVWEYIAIPNTRCWKWAPSLTLH